MRETNGRPPFAQTYINRALRGYIDDFCIVYLDDILIFSRTQEEHEEHLALVLERLRQFELYANPEKCEFYKQEVEFLGFIVNTTGIKMDPKRVDTITAWRTSRPQTYRDIQVFLGFCIFCRRFIYGFSGIARPSHELLRGMRKGKKPGCIHTDWQEPQKASYQALIAAFVSTPVLRHYDPSRPLRLETDASDKALAGILLQLF